MKLSLFVPSVLLSLTVPGALVPEEAPKAKRVLIVTGADVPAHDWRATTPVTRAILEEAKGFAVFVSEEPAVLETPALASYDLVVLNYRNDPQSKLSEAARKNLKAFVEGGKGLAAVHFAVCAWGDWEDYAKMVGRIWVGKRAGVEKPSGHGPMGTFKVQVKARDHAITSGLQDFETRDELYARLAGDTPIEVLASAHSDWSGSEEPLAWTVRCGQGRVFVTVLGHDVPARENPGFRKLLARGCAWAAGGGAAP